MTTIDLDLDFNYRLSPGPVAPRPDLHPPRVNPQPQADRGFMVDAACRGATHIFFPVHDDYRPAQAICATCPVRVECLEYALTMKEMHGIWGGLTEKGRRRELRRRAQGRRNG